MKHVAPIGILDACALYPLPQSPLLALFRIVSRYSATLSKTPTLLRLMGPLQISSSNLACKELRRWDSL